jgi:hypothetical protein
MIHSELVRIKVRILLCVMVILLHNTLSAQRQHTHNCNAWFAYIGDHKISKKFGLHLEYQERRANVIAENMQHLFRTAINYHVLPNVFVSAGYAYVYTYPYGGFPVKSTFPEHRIYQQLQYNTAIQKSEVVTRFRLEQRFNYLPQLQANGQYKSSSKSIYTNRFRISQRLSLPFTGNTIKDKNFYATTFNELFINFGKNVAQNIFDQNRFFLGLGYKLPKVGRLEFGYLNQILVKPSGLNIENNHTLSLALNANFNLKSL